MVKNGQFSHFQILAELIKFVNNIVTVKDSTWCTGHHFSLNTARNVLISVQRHATNNSAEEEFCKGFIHWVNTWLLTHNSLYLVTSLKICWVCNFSFTPNTTIWKWKGSATRCQGYLENSGGRNYLSARINLPTYHGGHFSTTGGSGITYSI